MRDLAHFLECITHTVASRRYRSLAMWMLTIALLAGLM